MRKMLKSLLELIGIFTILIFAVMYLINFAQPGTLGFMKRDTIIYEDSEGKVVTSHIKIGESVSVLTDYTDSDFVKIRYTTDNGKEDIGFVSENSCYCYEFPYSDTEYSQILKPIVLSLKDGTSFEDFIKALTNVPEDYSILGVYLEVSEYSDDTSEITYFCEQQKIPYGVIYPLTDSKYDSYITESANELVEEVETSKILPQVFDITREANTSKYNLTDCILLDKNTSSSTNENSWIIDVDTETMSDNESIHTFTLFDNNSVGYAFVSDEFKNNVIEKYNELNATQD